MLPENRERLPFFIFDTLYLYDTVSGEAASFEIDTCAVMAKQIWWLVISSLSLEKSLVKTWVTEMVQQWFNTGGF